MTEKGKTKVCGKCGKEKVAEDFYRRAASPDGLQNYCKACNSEAGAAIHKKKYGGDPEYRERRKKEVAEYRRRTGYKATPEQRRGYHIKKKYGLTSASYKALLASQGGVCAICGNPPSEERRLSIDHDHDTNEVRGILCELCNRGLGQFGDRLDLLLRAADYLKGNKGYGPLPFIA